MTQSCLRWNHGTILKFHSILWEIEGQFQGARRRWPDLPCGVKRNQTIYGPLGGAAVPVGQLVNQAWQPIQEPKVDKALANISLRF